MQLGSELLDRALRPVLPLPDLRASGFLGSEFFYRIVLDGVLKDAGMVSCSAVLSHEDATTIQNFLVHRANQDKSSAEITKASP
jgi:hypothetical protein